MLLQCVKCSLFFRSFPKIKTHKQQGPCSDKPKEDVKNEQFENVVKDDNGIGPPIENLELKDEPDDKKDQPESKDQIEKKEESTEITEVPEQDDETKEEVDKVVIKQEPMEEDANLNEEHINKSYSSEVYVPAPVVDLDSDDEYVAESDESGLPLFACTCFFLPF